MMSKCGNTGCKHYNETFLNHCQSYAVMAVATCKDSQWVPASEVDLDADLERDPDGLQQHEPRGKALKKALEIINGERQDSYGSPENSFQLIADYWTCYLESVGAGTGQMIKPRQVAEMMALFKIARMSGQKTTADNYADCAGYIGIAGDMI